MTTDKYKTELCKSWALNGFCRYGWRCQFAHGWHDLRWIHPEPCSRFVVDGHCIYGKRCYFQHVHCRRLPVFVALTSK